MSRSGTHEYRVQSADHSRGMRHPRWGAGGIRARPRDPHLSWRGRSGRLIFYQTGDDDGNSTDETPAPELTRDSIIRPFPPPPA